MSTGDGSGRARITGRGIVAARNGLTVRAYPYRGTGEDTLTGGLSTRQLNEAALRATGMSGLEPYGHAPRTAPRPKTEGPAQ